MEASLSGGICDKASPMNALNLALSSCLAGEYRNVSQAQRGYLSAFAASLRDAKALTGCDSHNPEKGSLCTKKSSVRPRISSDLVRMFDNGSCSNAECSVSVRIHPPRLSKDACALVAYSGFHVGAARRSATSSSSTDTVISQPLSDSQTRISGTVPSGYEHSLFKERCLIHALNKIVHPFSPGYERYSTSADRPTISTMRIRISFPSASVSRSSSPRTKRNCTSLSLLTEIL